MRTILIKLIIATLTLSATTFANAAVLLDPYLGHTITGDWEMGAADEKFTNLTFGSRLGYQTIEGLQFGLDVQLGKGKFNYQGGGDDSTSNTDFGAFVGYQSFMGFRAYFAYMFSGQYKVDSANNPPTFKGSALKIGVGYQFMEHFTMNLEYIANTYGKVKDEDGTSDLGSDLKANAIMISASFPFSLM